MKIVFKGPEENLEEEGIPCYRLKNGTLFKLGDGVFFISSASFSYDTKKLMTRLDTGVTYTVGFNLIRKKDIIKDSTLTIEEQ